MKMTKRILATFAFYDRTGIQAFLEKQAEKGWMFEKFGILGWKFRRIQPKKLHFAVTYFPKASQFDPEPPEDPASVPGILRPRGLAVRGRQRPDAGLLS